MEYFDKKKNWLRFVRQNIWIDNSVTINDDIYILSGHECDSDGISNCYETTRLHKYSTSTNQFILDVFGSLLFSSDGILLYVGIMILIHLLFLYLLVL